jgi:hypothetical protein
MQSFLFGTHNNFIYLGAIGGYILIFLLIAFIIFVRFLVLRNLEFSFLSSRYKKLTLSMEILYFGSLTLIKNAIYIPIIYGKFPKNSFNFILNISSEAEEYLNYFGISQILNYSILYTLFLLILSVLFFKFICKWQFKTSLKITLLLFVITKITIGVVLSLIPLTMDYILSPVGKLISKSQSSMFFNFINGIFFIQRYFFNVFFRAFLWIPFP